MGSIAQGLKDKEQKENRKRYAAMVEREEVIGGVNHVKLFAAGEVPCNFSGRLRQSEEIKIAPEGFCNWNSDAIYC